MENRPIADPPPLSGKFHYFFFFFETLPYRQQNIYYLNTWRSGVWASQRFYRVFLVCATYWFSHSIQYNNAKTMCVRYKETSLLISAYATKIFSWHQQRTHQTTLGIVAYSWASWHIKTLYYVKPKGNLRYFGRIIWSNCFKMQQSQTLYATLALGLTRAYRILPSLPEPIRTLQYPSDPYRTLKANA